MERIPHFFEERAGWYNRVISGTITIYIIAEHIQTGVAGRYN